MIIGIDIDDTITNHCEVWFDIYNEYFKSQDDKEIKLSDAYKWDFYNEYDNQTKNNLFCALNNQELYYQNLQLLDNVSNTIKELKEHADLIVKATVKEEHAWVDGVATIGTEYVLEINKCYIGKAQNTIIVNNLGGTILASKYLEKQNDPKMDELKKKVEKNPDNSYVRFQFDGAWQPEKGKQYIWFLEENEENGTITYAPINVYEGVYEIDQDIVKRYNEENTNNSTTRSSQLSDDKMTLSEMEAKINQ